jgi:hypothetical protein
LVERGPEKAGVGGSIPSLATNPFNNLAIAKNMQISSRAQYAYIYFSIFTFGVARSIDFQASQPVLLALAVCCRTSFICSFFFRDSRSFTSWRNRGRLLFAL